MIKLNLDRIFSVKGIRNPNTYLVKKGHSSGYATRLINNRAISVPFDKLEAFCIDFNCTPNDLFDYVPSKGQELPAGHALHTISKTEAIGEVNRLLNDMPLKKIEELYAILKREEGEV